MKFHSSVLLSKYHKVSLMGLSSSVTLDLIFLTRDKKDFCFFSFLDEAMCFQSLD